MKTIENIRKDKGNHYVATFDDGDKLRVNEDVLVKFRLHKDKQITQEEYEELQTETGFQVGLQVALRYLDYQMRTEYEIRMQLKGKNIPTQEIRKIIERLYEMRLLNDLSYAQSFVRTQKNTSDKGPLQIRQLLYRKGVKDEWIDEAMEEFPEEEQNESASKIAQKLTKKYARKSYKEGLMKIRQSLMTKGYYSHSIDYAMEQLEFEKDEEEEWELLLIQAQKLWQKNSRLEDYKRTFKVKQSLYQKGFDIDDINNAIEEVKEYE